MTVEVKQLKGSGTVPFGVPFRNVYILNDGGKGWIRINDTLKLDIEKIDRVEGLTIKKLEWNLTSDGNAVFVILSHEKLSTEYITRLMLSRIYSELQKKSSKKKLVYVDASSSTTVPAGSPETITIQPPDGKIWRVVDVTFKATPPSGATSGTHYVGFGHYGCLTPELPKVGANYDNYITIHNTYVISYNTIDFASKSDFLGYVRGRKFSHSYPLQISYTNSTDADQTNARIIRLIVEEEDEAP